MERARQLYEGGAIPLKQLQTAEFELKQAQAQLEGAKRSKAQAEAAQAQQRSSILPVSSSSAQSARSGWPNIASRVITGPA